MPANGAKVEISESFRRGQVAGCGMGIFAMCILFDKIVSTGWPRLAMGTLGAIFWLFMVFHERRKAHGPGVEAAPTPPAVDPS